MPVEIVYVAVIAICIFLFVKLKHFAMKILLCAVGIGAALFYVIPMLTSSIK